MGGACAGRPTDTMAYASLSDLKAYVSVTDTTDDALLTDFLSAAEKVIDAFTRRRFEASADSTRYFHALDDVQGRTLQRCTSTRTCARSRRSPTATASR